MSLSRTTAFAAALAALTTALSAAALPAAAAGVPATARHPTALVQRASAADARGPQDFFLVGAAGYQLSQVKGKQSAQATFTVPTLKCSAAGDRATAVGVDLIPKSVITLDGSSVLLWCHNGTPMYAGQFTLNGFLQPNLSVTVAAGDSITVGLAVTKGKAGTSLSFADTTQHFSTTLTGPGASGATHLYADASGYAIKSGVTAPVPNFGTITFSSTTMNGKTLAAGGATPLNRTNKKGKVEIAAGPLAASGDGFTLTYRRP